LERKRPSTALPIAESLEVDAVSLTSPSGEAVRIVDEGAGAFSLVFEKKAWFYGLGAVDEKPDRRRTISYGDRRHAALSLEGFWREDARTLTRTTDAMLLTCEGAMCAAHALTGPIFIDVYAGQSGVERHVHLLLDDGETERSAKTCRSVEAVLSHRSDASGSIINIAWMRDDWAELSHLRVRVRGIFSAATADGAALPMVVRGRGQGSPWSTVELPRKTSQLLFLC
jgi:hypothetical protein